MFVFGLKVIIMNELTYKQLCKISVGCYNKKEEEEGRRFCGLSSSISCFSTTAVS